MEITLKMMTRDSEANMRLDAIVQDVVIHCKWNNIL